MRKNKLPENHNFQFGKALPVSRIIFTDFFLFVIVKMERHLREECTKINAAKQKAV